MIDQRLAELRQARELLAEFEALAASESREFQALLSSHQTEERAQEAERVTESFVEHTEAAHSATERPSSPGRSKSTASKASNNARKQSVGSRKVVVMPKAMTALGGVVPVGPVVVGPRESSAPDASLPSELDTPPLVRSESSLDELAREVAARMRINTHNPLNMPPS